MTQLLYYIILFILVYLSIGIGTSIKLSNYMTPIIALKICFVIPIPTIWASILILSKLLRVVNEEKILNFMIFVIILKVWFNCIPAIATKFAIIIINNHKDIKKIYRKTKNECYDYLHGALNKRLAC